MERKRPIIQNKVEVPVNIFKGQELIAECIVFRRLQDFSKKKQILNVLIGLLLIRGFGTVNRILKMELLIILQPIKKLLRRKLDTM
jgi:hypothetical protein